VHQTLSGGIPDSPVNYSGDAPRKPEGEEFELIHSGAPDTVRWHTGQSGAPDQGCLRFPFCFFLLRPNLFFWFVCVEPLAPVKCIILNKLVSPIICVGQFNHQNLTRKRFDPISLSPFTCKFAKETLSFLRINPSSLGFACRPLDSYKQTPDLLNNRRFGPNFVFQTSKLVYFISFHMNSKFSDSNCKMFIGIFSAQINYVHPLSVHSNFMPRL
jgi:hypothetical protein